MFLHTAVQVIYSAYIFVAVLSSENIGIEYYLVGISSGTSIVLHV